MTRSREFTNMHCVGIIKAAGSCACRAAHGRSSAMSFICGTICLMVMALSGGRNDRSLPDTCQAGDGSGRQSKMLICRRRRGAGFFSIVFPRPIDFAASNRLHLPRIQAVCGKQPWEYSQGKPRRFSRRQSPVRFAQIVGAVAGADGDGQETTPVRSLAFTARSGSV